MKKLILILKFLIPIFLVFLFPVENISASTKSGNTYHIKTAIIQYVPANGIRSVYSGAEVPDPVSFTQNTLLPALNSTSKYHGYKQSNSTPTLYYTLSDQDIFTENSLPPQKGSTPQNYDYQALFKKYDLCRYALDNDIGMVIVWAGGDGLYEGGMYESVITGSKNVFTNGPILPYCPQKTILILGLNYERGLAEAMESYGHHLESAFRSKLGVKLYSSWSGTSGGRTALDSYPGSAREEHCGGAHDPPNATHEYDRTNRSFVKTDCEKFDFTNNQKNNESINCLTWGCTRAGYLTWWMQNMPGEGNALYTNGSKIPDWWVVIGDPDNCADNPLSCGGVSNIPVRPSTLALEIDGNTQDNQEVRTGKINLSAKLFNSNLSPNDGCPSNQLITFKINNQKVTEIAPCQPFEYIIPSKISGGFTFSADFLGEGAVEASQAHLTFTAQPSYTPSETPELTPTPTTPPLESQPSESPQGNSYPSSLYLGLITDQGESAQQNQTLKMGDQIKFVARVYNNKHQENDSGCVPLDNRPVVKLDNNTLFPITTCNSTAYTIPHLNQGNHHFTLSFSGESNYGAAPDETLNFTVIEPTSEPSNIPAESPSASPQQFQQPSSIPQTKRVTTVTIDNQLLWSENGGNQTAHLSLSQGLSYLMIVNFSDGTNRSYAINFVRPQHSTSPIPASTPQCTSDDDYTDFTGKCDASSCGHAFWKCPGTGAEKSFGPPYDQKNGINCSDHAFNSACTTPPPPTQQCTWNFLRNECTGCNQARSVEENSCTHETRISQEGVHDSGCSSWCRTNNCITSCGKNNGQNCTNHNKANAECADYYNDDSTCSFTDGGPRGDGCIP